MHIEVSMTGEEAKFLLKRRAWVWDLLSDIYGREWMAELAVLYEDGDLDILQPVLLTTEIDMFSGERTGEIVRQRTKVPTSYIQAFQKHEHV